MNFKKINNSGMTFPELVLAIGMLTAFTAITVMVTQFTTSFFQPLNTEENQEVIDKINDHSDINHAFDKIIDILSEPGIDKNFISKLECTSRPQQEWKIPAIIETAIPKSYKICIKPSSLVESNYPDIISDKDGKPGIYILYSKPVGGITVNAIPIRRIFCRPKPFCNP